MTDWSNVVSGIAGVVGAITGIISLVEVRKLKSQDLSMEHGRLLNTIQVALDGLNDLGEKANKSRIYRFSAQGLSRSGPMEKWKKDFEENSQKIKSLSEQFTQLKNNPPPAKNLQSDILKLHSIEEWVKSIAGDFTASIAEDDVAREHLARQKSGT